MNNIALSRRKFLQAGSAALTLPLAAAVPAAAEMHGPRREHTSHRALIPSRTLPVRQRGATVIPVDPPTDGVSDCSSVIQAAIDALPEDGGTVLIRYHQTQGGRDCIYMIDASAHTLSGSAYGIMLRSNMMLQCEPGVQLKVIPNNLAHSYAIWGRKGVHDVEIANLVLIGERDNHVMSGTGTDEWGIGIFIKGMTQTTIRSSHISNFEGDGISITYAGSPATLPSDIVVWDTVCTGNRRQAVSITGADGIYLLDSEFSHTHGTAPADGIDIEVEWSGAPIRNITIDNCIIRNNQSNGVELNASDSAGLSITNVNITNCVLSGNYSGVYAGTRSTSVLDTATIYGNAIYQNRATGIYLQGSGQPKNFTIGGSSPCDPRNNSFANNQVSSSHHYIDPISATKPEKGYVAGTDMSFSALALAPEANNVVGWNDFYSPDDESSWPPRPCEPPAWGHDNGHGHDDDHGHSNDHGPHGH